MVRAPFGKPSTVEDRGRAGVAVPGNINTRSSESREVKGRSVICRPLIVVPTVALCVCNTAQYRTTICDLTKDGQAEQGQAHENKQNLRQIIFHRGASSKVILRCAQPGKT